MQDAFDVTLVCLILMICWWT